MDDAAQLDGVVTEHRGVLELFAQARGNRFGRQLGWISFGDELVVPVGAVTAEQDVTHRLIRHTAYRRG